MNIGIDFIQQNENCNLSKQCHSECFKKKWLLKNSLQEHLMYSNKEYLTCTCIGFHPGRVEPASSRASKYVVQWRRYFGIWLKEGSQVIPEKTPCWPQIFHRRINKATRGRRLPEQTPPGFSPEPFLPGCWPKTVGYQTNPPWVALPGTEARWTLGGGGVGL